MLLRLRASSASTYLGVENSVLAPFPFSWVPRRDFWPPRHRAPALLLRRCPALLLSLSTPQTPFPSVLSPPPLPNPAPSPHPPPTRSVPRFADHLIEPFGEWGWSATPSAAWREGQTGRDAGRTHHGGVGRSCAALARGPSKDEGRLAAPLTGAQLAGHDWYKHAKLSWMEAAELAGGREVLGDATRAAQ